jgi:hypothetical protein
MHDGAIVRDGACLVHQYGIGCARRQDAGLQFDRLDRFVPPSGPPQFGTQDDAILLARCRSVDLLWRRLDIPSVMPQVRCQNDRSPSWLTAVSN